VIDQEKFKMLTPLACAWAKGQEEMILQQGAPLGRRRLEDARRAGVQNPERIRMLVVERMPVPENLELAEAARHAQIITDACLGMTLGHGIIVRADRWQDRELIVHLLVHVAQCERAGGLEPWIHEYLGDRQAANFSVGLYEEEARRMAREICAAETGASLSR
jgi:hypothetical protein